MRNIVADGAMHCTKVDDKIHIAHILIIPNAIPKIVRHERTTPVVQMDCTYRTSKFVMQMLHIVASTNLNIIYTLSYYFMSSTLEDDYERVLHAYLDLRIIVDPRAIVTDAEKH